MLDASNVWFISPIHEINTCFINCCKSVYKEKFLLLVEEAGELSSVLVLKGRSVYEGFMLYVGQKHCNGQYKVSFLSWINADKQSKRT